MFLKSFKLKKFKVYFNKKIKNFLKKRREMALCKIIFQVLNNQTYFQPSIPLEYLG